MKDDETLNVYDQRAGDYAKHFGVQKPSKSLTRFMSHLPPNARVMDLGCGPGDSAAIMRDAGFQVDAVDASKGMIEQANSKYGLNARYATFDDLDTVREFDGIWANFSLLHARKADFPRYLKSIHTALKDDGIFHIGTKLKTDHDEARDSIGRFYSYYDQDELMTYLQTAGFTAMQTDTGKEIGLSGSSDPFILVLCHA